MSQYNKPDNEPFSLSPGLNTHTDGIFYGGMMGIMLAAAGALLIAALGPMGLAVTGGVAPSFFFGYTMSVISLLIIGSCCNAGYEILKETSKKRHVITALCSALLPCAMTLSTITGIGPHQAMVSAKSAFNAVTTHSTENSDTAPAVRITNGRPGITR